MAGAQIQCSWAVNVGSFVSRKLRSDRNGNNYEAWREQMLCLVQSQGLVGYIDGSRKAPPPQNDDAEVWRRKDWLVKGWILGALNDEVIKTVVNLDTARDVWLTLGYKFSKSGRAAPPPPPPVAVTSQGKEWHEYSELYRAAMRGDWDTAEQILKQDPEAIKVRMGFSLETALHVATRKSRSFVSKLVDSMSDKELAITDGLGYNPLHVAARTGNRHAAELLVHRLPDIALDLVNEYPHLARLRPPSMGSALNKMAVKVTAFSPDAQLNFWERLLYSCIKVEMEMGPQSFHGIHNQTCCNANLGPLSLKRSKEERKLHSAFYQLIKHFVPRIKKIHEKKLIYKQALRLVKCLCKHMESLKDEAAAIYKEAILTAAEYGIHEIVEVIVGTFPPAVHSTHADTNHTFLNLAVRNRCVKVFNLMYQGSNYRYHHSDPIDSSGNSILHLAAALAPPHKLNLVSGPALQMQREIQWFQEVDKFVSPYYRQRRNLAGKTAEMIFTDEHKKLKEEGEKWMKDTANSCTTAAALIATVVFAAAITVPGGNDSNSGYPIFSRSSAFTIFVVSDAISLFTSTTSLLMFLSILTSRYEEQDFLYALPKRLCIGLVTLFLSILFMMAAFASTVYLVFGRKSAYVLMPVGVLACLPLWAFVLLQFPLLTNVISSTYGRGVFGKQSHRPFH